MRTKKNSQFEKEIEIAASTALRYSDSPKDELSNVRVRIRQLKEKEVKELQVSPLDDKILNQLRICFLKYNNFLQYINLKIWLLDLHHNNI